MPFNNYPYTNLNDLNLDFILERVKESPGDYAAQAAASALAASASATAAAGSASAAAAAAAAAKKTNYVIFGDSWSDPSLSQNTWMATFDAITRWTCLHNYAVNAAGFVAHAPNLISNQVAAFLLSSYVNTTDYILMVGGVNDYRNGITRVDLRNEINSIVSDLRAAGYKGKIVYITNFEYPYDYAATTYWGVLCTQVGTQIATINTYGILAESWMDSNNYFHLTSNGSQVFGEIIAASLGYGTFSPERPTAEISGKAYFEYEYNCRSVTVHCNAIMPQGQTSMSWTTSDIDLVSWIKKAVLIGTVGRSYNRFILQINADGSGSMVTEAAPNADTQVHFSWTYSV